MKTEIEKTADGSPTLYRRDMDEHYHSVKGALAESLHIYLDLGWREAALMRQPVRVFEVGFGTGLNAALTAHAAFESRIPTIYHSIELYPLPTETTELLMPLQEKCHREEFRAVNEAEWGVDVVINPFFTIRKINGDILSTELTKGIDVVYFDAFAPEKQPEMWSSHLFERLYLAMSEKGILTTYCAKGSIRRMLQEIGFLTQRLPGPPGGKREILRGIKP